MAVLRSLACCLLVSILPALRPPGDPVGDHEGDLTGEWQGRMACRSVSGALAVVLAQDHGRWSGSATITSGPNTLRSALHDVKVDGDALSFTAVIERADVLFDGTLGADEIRGTVVALEGGHTLDEGTWAVSRGGQPVQLASADRIAPDERRAAVASLAQLLRRSYVDPAKGLAMATDLERRSAAGELDRFEDPRVLVDEIGRGLFAIAGDKHLEVRWHKAAVPPESSETPETERDREALRQELRRENFGFRKVEILPGNVGYFALSRFVRADLAGESAAAAMGFLGHCDALVIDLRDCGGGDPGMVAFLASWLFDGRAVHVADLYRREDDVSVQWWTSAWVPGRRLATAPVCVLTAQRLFSAAEALAFHLQKLGRATVVGETTGGGAHPVRRLRVSGHIAVAMPTSRAMDPATKSDWEGVGVKPDVVAKAEDALRTAHALLLEGLVAAEPDPEAQRVLREILATIRATPSGTGH